MKLSGNDPAIYRITIVGAPRDEWIECLPELSVTVSQGNGTTTQLVGRLADQAALLGLLAALDSWGTPLLAVDLMAPT